MAGFKQGGIEFKKKSVIGNPTTAEHIIVYWNDIDDLIIKTSTGEDVIATESLVASISGNLQFQLDNLSGDFIGLTDTPANYSGSETNVVTVGISGGLVFTPQEEIAPTLTYGALSGALDPHYVNVSGDAMTGVLSLPQGSRLAPSLSIGSGLGVTKGLYEVSIAELGVSIDNTEVISFRENGIQLNDGGTRINEFSNDNTLGDNSATAVPTERAVKTYVDNSGYWDRTGTTLSPKTTGDSVLISGGGTASIETVEQVKTDHLKFVNNINNTQHITGLSYYDGSTLTFDVYYAKLNDGWRYEIFDNTGGFPTLQLEQDTGIATFHSDINTKNGDINIQSGDLNVTSLAPISGNLLTTDVTGKVVDSGINSTTLADDFVNVTGDTMTGPLEIEVASGELLTIGNPDSGVAKYLRVRRSSAGVNFGMDASNFMGVQVGTSKDFHIKMDRSTTSFDLTDPDFKIDRTGWAEFKSDLTVGGDTILNGDLTINGNVTQISGGGFFTQIAETVQIQDNLVVLNYGETGSGISLNQSGVQVDRGTADDYFFMFDETIDNGSFVIGMSGGLQPVATRDLDANMIQDGLAFWNDSERRFDTSSTYTLSTLTTDSELTSISGNLQIQITGLVSISGSHDTRITTLETYTNGITGGITQINETISKSWSSLVNTWTAEPTFNINISGSGDVYDYVYDTTTYFRLVPEPYDSTQDTFYSNFNGTDTLTGVVATRGQGI